MRDRFEEDKFVRCNWSTPGSLDLLHELVDQLQHVDYITPVCNKLHVSVVQRGTAYLGRGAEAVVIEVNHTELGNVALKVYHSEIKKIPRARASYERTLELQQILQGDALDVFVHVIPDTLMITEVGSDLVIVGFLLCDIGTAPKTSARREVSAIMFALLAFHVLGYCHFDPRVQNLLLVGNVLKWIDLGQWTNGTKTLIKRDVTILLKSLNREIDDRMSLAIDMYAEAPSKETMEQLI